MLSALPLGYPPHKQIISNPKYQIVLGVAEQKFGLHLRDFKQGYFNLEDYDNPRKGKVGALVFELSATVKANSFGNVACSINVVCIFLVVKRVRKIFLYFGVSCHFLLMSVAFAK
ncbi:MULTISPECIES: hypothetical protein [unclassified Anabaena]|uniref:hypothetical protein n=1 Tax=unclassified Anabaena TaxID=2619674 RepID=UPI001445D151|nr:MULTISPECIES: hypothetical protein [unclassified Anabaena]MTJ07604.1 hypothetical protein [Anabaena sp. UHCC 0204]MTJ51427.1 hypothetical protein [Anabaena sp. UHCC 0253]